MSRAASVEYLVCERTGAELPVFIGTVVEVSNFLGCTIESVRCMACRNNGQYEIIPFQINELEEADE